MLDKIVYNTVLSQAFSPCGNYLVAGNIYDQIAVFDLSRIQNPDVELLTDDYNKPKYIHHIPGSQISTLLSTENYLIVGTAGEIKSYEWPSVLISKLGKPFWKFNLPSKLPIEQLDVNCLWLSEDKETLFAGAGDNCIYVYDLENVKFLTKYEKHTDYVHCIHGKDQQLISASEDGSVRLWDIRTGKSHNSIEPYKNVNVNRPDIGKWVGAVALSDDWIVCGGGPRLALWHLRSLEAVTIFDIPDHGIHVSFFHEDCVFAAGAAKHLYQLDYSGEVKVELPVSATTVYSVALRTSPEKVLAVAGSSADIDLCTTFNYRDQILHFR